MVDQLAYLSTDTACITTMRGQICLVLCKLHSSSATWVASVMASFSCLGPSVSVPPCSLCVIYTSPSSVSSCLVELFS